MERPTFRDVLRAREIIRHYLSPPPLYHYASLDQLLGCATYVKHENHQPIGAFKVRGGINLIASLSEAECHRGVITASTGNHGQSIAYAARLFGVEARVVVPEGANPGKVEAIRNLGAEVIFRGHDFDDARLYTEQQAETHGYRYIHSANEPLLIAGVGTYTLEILEAQPEIETIIVPVGGGSGASGSSIVAKAIDPQIEVIGVQSERAPAAYLAWNEGRPVEAEMETFAEGLATRFSFELTQSILQDLLDDFILVSDEELKHAIVLLLENTHNLAEGAGAAALAAALKLRDRLAGRKVALILSGGNLSLDRLREAVASGRK
ncbi:MAG: threonine/serine dehydratase [Candidatus Bipolaricaulia bacterium]